MRRLVLAILLGGSTVAGGARAAQACDCQQKQAQKKACDCAGQSCVCPGHDEAQKQSKPKPDKPKPHA